MKRMCFLLFFISLISGAYAQDQWAAKVFAGTSQYLGDLNKENPVYQSAPSYGFGLNFQENLRYGFNLHFAYHTLKGSTAHLDDFVHPNYPGSQHRFNTRLIDVSAEAEFNFLPFEIYNIRKENFTPFIFAGLGFNYFLTDQENQFPLIIPFGLGIKYNIFERFSIGIQWTAKKTFFDQMDGVTNISQPGKSALIHNDDWYHHAVFFITYHPFRESIKCPTYEE